MIAFLLSRLSSALVVAAGVVIVTFFLVHLVPGDPIDMMLGESALPADRERLLQAYHLDKPLPVQLSYYLYDLIHFDMGDSIVARRPITDLLAERLPGTGKLAAAALLIAMILAVPLGCIAAIRQHSLWDRLAMGFSLLGMSIPNFWLGPLFMLLFAFWLGWLPVSGSAGALSIFLPALTLGTSMAAIVARMIRSTLVEILSQAYIRTARAKGLTGNQVLFRHALPNAMLPLITLVGLQLGALLGGAVITETIFSWPGIGELFVDAILKRDYALVQACVLVISLSYVIINTFTDILYAWIDPRIRLGT